tara:strand:+ start:298 stop:750 length:453 start_codon:yes stop_codon:yes gene_type:complete
MTQDVTDTTELTEQEKLVQLQDNQLVDLGANLKDEIKILSDRLTRIKFILRQRLIDKKAKAFLHPTIDCKGVYKPNTFNYNVLKPLLEILDQETLDHMYTPKGTKEIIVEEDWDMRKVKSLNQFGEEFQDIIDKATIPGELYDIAFKRKE